MAANQKLIRCVKAFHTETIHPVERRVHNAATFPGNFLHNKVKQHRGSLGFMKGGAVGEKVPKCSSDAAAITLRDLEERDPRVGWVQRHAPTRLPRR